MKTVSENGLVEETGYNNKGIVADSVVYHRANPDVRFAEKVEVAR